MNQSARQAKIAQLIEVDGEVSVPDLADNLDVSEMTIRRDLDSLAQQGRIIRTHGGAAAAGRVSFEFGFLKKRKNLQNEKDEIGRLAADLVSDGQSVILDSGTTTLAVARALRGRSDLTVITSSLPIASELQYQQAISVLLLGGYLRSSSPDLSGGLTERNLDALRADVAFLGADGVEPDGSVYNEAPDIAHMLTRMAASAAVVYVVADHSKFAKRALMRYGNVNEWEGLITDDDADPGLVRALIKSGVHVVQP
jgi:DeoR/GlpR family transcriptional regulator of sugar metabolism